MKTIAIQSPSYTRLHSIWPLKVFPLRPSKNIELETLHGVKYTGLYENDTACRNVISGIGDYLFDENVKKNLKLVNFISILCDGVTDKSVTEQEVLFVVFTDPANGK